MCTRKKFAPKDFGYFENNGFFEIPLVAYLDSFPFENQKEAAEQDFYYTWQGFYDVVSNQNQMTLSFLPNCQKLFIG